MHRVEDLATDSINNFSLKQDKNGVVWVTDPKNIRPSSVSLVPLLEILAEVYSSAPNSQKVLTVFDSLVQEFGSEHEILLRSSLDEVRKLAGNDVSEGIEKVRARNIKIIPGFDGKYRDWETDRKSTRLNSSHSAKSRMPSSA